MVFTEQLEVEPLSELVRYRPGSPGEAVAYSGTPRKHPYDEGRCILFTESGDREPAILEFRKSDIVAVEEMPSIVDETGHSRPMRRLWIKRGSLGLRYEPFEVGEQARVRDAAGKARLNDRLMSGSRGAAL